MSGAASLHAIEEQHPEWKPWLGVVREVLTALDGADWSAAVPQAPSTREPHVPLLANAAVALDPEAAGRLFMQIARAASSAPAFATLRAERADANAVFRAGLELDEDALRGLAETAQVEPQALRAIAALLPMPFLHACQRAWHAAKPQAWSRGYCPLCGSWPAFAEICGVERARYLRCGRCGSGWPSRVLSCAYCGTTDHEELASLVPESTRMNATIETCNACRGYMKAFTKLRPTPPESVVLDDLASVELDMVAAEHGYRRPPGAGYAPGVRMVAAAAPSDPPP